MISPYLLSFLVAGQMLAGDDSVQLCRPTLLEKVANKYFLNWSDSFISFFREKGKESASS